MLKCILLSLIFLCARATHAQLTVLDSTWIKVDTVYTGLDVPWELQVDPLGNLWVSERIGRVQRINPQLQSSQEVLNIIDSVYQISESGLLGLALHPSFTGNGSANDWIYLVYTWSESQTINDMWERVVRYRFDGNALIAPQILMDSIPAYNTHNGSRLLFLTDGTLLISTGDAQIQSYPQNLSSQNGKILRMTENGSVPSDNPYSSSYVFSSGHRNVQGLVQAPWGALYVSEHGPNTDDEFQMLWAGQNYGWPNVQGYCDLASELTFCADSNVVEPLLAWTPTIAPSDLAWYPHSDIPEFQNRMLITTLKEQKLVAIAFNNTFDTVISAQNYLEDAFGRLRDIYVNADGSIYVATNGCCWQNIDPGTHSILKLSAIDVTSATQKNDFSGFEVFPNPFVNYFQYNAPQEGVAQLFTMEGRRVWGPRTFSSGTHRFTEGSSLATARYILTFTTKSMTYGKIIQKVD